MGLTPIKKLLRSRGRKGDGNSKRNADHHNRDSLAENEFKDCHYPGQEVFNRRRAVARCAGLRTRALFLPRATCCRTRSLLLPSGLTGTQALFGA